MPGNSCSNVVEIRRLHWLGVLQRFRDWFHCLASKMQCVSGKAQPDGLRSGGATVRGVSFRHITPWVLLNRGTPLSVGANFVLKSNLVVVVRNGRNRCSSSAYRRPIPKR